MSGPGRTARRWRVGLAALGLFLGTVAPSAGQRLDQVSLDGEPLDPLLTPDTVHYLEIGEKAGPLRLAFDLSAVSPLDKARVELYYASDSTVVALASQSYRPHDRLLQASFHLLAPGRFHPTVYVDSLPGHRFAFHVARMPWREHRGRCLRYEPLPDPPDRIVDAWLSPSGRLVRFEEGGWIDLPTLEKDRALVLRSDHRRYSTTIGWHDTLSFCVSGIQLATLRQENQRVDRLFIGERGRFTFHSDTGVGGLLSGENPLVSSDESRVGTLVTGARQNEVFLEIDRTAAPPDRVLVRGNQTYQLDLSVSELPVVDSLRVRQDGLERRIVRGRPLEVWQDSEVDLTLFGRNLKGITASWDRDVLPPPEPSQSDSILRQPGAVVRADAAIGRTSALRLDRIGNPLAEAVVVHDPRPLPFRLVLAHGRETCDEPSVSDLAEAGIDEENDPRILVCPKVPPRRHGPQYLVIHATVTAPWLDQPIVAADSVAFTGTATGWTEHAFAVDSVRTFEEILGRGAEHVYRDGAAVELRLTHAADFHRGRTGAPDALIAYNDGWGADATLGAIPGYAYLVEEKGGDDDRHLTSLGSLELVWTWYRRGQERWLKLHAGYSHFRDMGSSFDRNGLYGGVSIRPPFPGLQSTVFQFGAGVSTRGEVLLLVGPSFGKLGLGGP